MITIVYLPRPRAATSVATRIGAFPDLKSKKIETEKLVSIF